VQVGSTLRFSVCRSKIGTTSVSYAVDVFAQECEKLEEYPVFRTLITFVCVGAADEKQPLPPPADTTASRLAPEDRVTTL
jgi:acyl-CoA hydrolase